MDETTNQSCFLHGDFDGDRCQECADAAFGAALIARDQTALAEEVERRIKGKMYGVSLRAEPGGPFVWRTPHWDRQEEPPWKEWAADAAKALIEAMYADA